MAKSNETTNTTGPIQYRVNYQHVAKNFQLRGGSLVVPADSAKEAEEKALKILADCKLDSFRITIIKPF